MIGVRAALLAVLLAAQVPGAQAQPAGQPEAPASARPPVFLILDQERFFTQSDYGRSLIEQSEAEARALRAESETLDRQFEEEEQALTEQRPSLDPAEFRARAVAFDERVVAARREQEQKAQQLASRAEARRRAFFRNAGPVLLRLLEESGAGAIVEARSVLISKQDLNITDEAIKRLDAAIAAREKLPGLSGDPAETTNEE